METKKVEILGTRLSDVQQIAPSKLKINPLNSDYFREESDDYFTQLREDVRLRGIIVPLLAKRDDILLAGHNRLRVALELGLATVPVQYVLDALPEKAEREFIIKDNLYRRQFSTAEWIHLYKKLYPDFDAQIQQETRGGGQKWSKTENDALSKTEHSVLVTSSPQDNVGKRLTAQKIADDTGQKLSAVQKQLTKYRRELETSENLVKHKNNAINTFKAELKNSVSRDAKAINGIIIEEASAYFQKIEQNAKNESPKTILHIIKKVDALKLKLERLI
jgi:hypothetical protein